MTRDPNDPTRLTVVGATDLERRLIASAAAERPSPELTRRMGLALGLSVTAAAAATAPATAAAATTSAVVAKSIVGWVTAGLVAAVVTGGAVGLWMSSRSPAPSPPHAVTARPEAAPAPGEIAAPLERAHATQHHAASAPHPADLRGEIALIDAARDAVRGGAPERALILLRRYVTTYPTGTFRPEAAALRIEALVEKGQTNEARALARDFVAKHPDSPLVERVARLAADPAR